MKTKIFLIIILFFVTQYNVPAQAKDSSKIQKSEVVIRKAKARIDTLKTKYYKLLMLQKELVKKTYLYRNNLGNVR